MRQKKYVDLLPEYENISYIEGAARLCADGVMAGARLVRADKIIIATGSHPAGADIPGIDQITPLTSTTALELQELPKSMIVIGGGYIGCELAQMFSRAGVRVTLATRSRLLPAAEPEISAALTQYLTDEGLDVRTGLSYRRLDKAGKDIALTIARAGHETVLTGEHILLATGRIPNTEDLGLNEAGVELGQGGEICVDEHMRTTRKGVYAAGDVTGRDQFVYMAAYGAKLAAQNALNGDKLAYDNAAMPWVVFTDPQTAGVGLSESQATAAGYEVKTSIAPLDQIPRAIAARDARGLVKLVADKASDRLLGAQILAPEGADSIQTIAIALKFSMTTKQLGETIFPYLTTVEGLKLAAQGFDKDIAKLSCCAG